jgi:hypothetical protein
MSAATEAGDGGRLLEPVLTMRRRPTAAPGMRDEPRPRRRKQPMETATQIQ